MTIRKEINRKKRFACCVAYAGSIPIVISLFVGYTPNNPPWYAILGFAVSGIAILAMYFGVRCPKCRGNLGYLVASTGTPFAVSKKIHYCMYCGTDMDASECASRSQVQSRDGDIDCVSDPSFRVGQELLAGGRTVVTIREAINQKKKIACCVTYTGFIPFSIGLFAGYLPNNPPWYCILGFVVSAAGGLGMQFGIRCPKCRGNLGYLVFSSGHAFSVSKNIRYCPYCGTDIDATECKSR